MLVYRGHSAVHLFRPDTVKFSAPSTYVELHKTCALRCASIMRLGSSVPAIIKLDARPKTNSVYIFQD